MARSVNIPRNVSVDGNLSIVVVPKATLTTPGAPTVAILSAAEDITYSMPTDGWSPSTSQDTETDERLALRDKLESPGAVTNGLEVTYFYGHEDDVMDPLLVGDAELYVIARDSVAIEDNFVAGQKVDVYAVRVGAPRKNVTTHGKQTKTAKLFVQQKLNDVLVVA